MYYFVYDEREILKQIDVINGIERDKFILEKEEVF